MSEQVWTKELLEAHIQEGSRKPFQVILAESLAVRTTPEALQSFADKAPDRKAQMDAIYARLAGYTEKQEHIGTLGVLDLARLSDAELQKRLLELQAEMVALPPKPNGDEA